MILWQKADRHEAGAVAKSLRVGFSNSVGFSRQQAGGVERGKGREREEETGSDTGFKSTLVTHFLQQSHHS